MRFHIITFGCQMNAGDSAWLARSLTTLGWEEAAVDDADVVVVNTCSVREKPEQKVYSELGRLARIMAHNPRAFAAVGGCVAQQLGAKFFERFGHVRLVFGTDGLSEVPQAMQRLVADPSLRLCLTDFVQEYRERDPALDGIAPGQGPTQAFVTIMQGCDNFCAYCIVPYVRGRQKSRSPESVLDECRRLVEGGAREITLLGQNVNSYGLDDQGAGVGFAELLRRVAALPGLDRLRFTTSHPKDLDDAVVRAFAELPNLCPALHLPLQAGSDAVLKRMNRRYDTARYRRIVADLRSSRPDIALSTDLIVGFPGETEEDFQRTLELVEEVGYNSSFSFKYNDRPLAAAGAFEPKVPEEVKTERLARLQALQDRLTAADFAAQVGRETEVLFEAPSRRQDPYISDVPAAIHPGAYAAGHAPDILAACTWYSGRDPQGRVVNAGDLAGVLAPAGPPGTAGGNDLTGTIARVMILEAKKHSLLGRLAG